MYTIQCLKICILSTSHIYYIFFVCLKFQDYFFETPIWNFKIVYILIHLLNLLAQCLIKLFSVQIIFTLHSPKCIIYIIKFSDIVRRTVFASHAFWNHELRHLCRQTDRQNLLCTIHVISNSAKKLLVNIIQALILVGALILIVRKYSDQICRNLEPMEAG